MLEEMYINFGANVQSYFVNFPCNDFMLSTKMPAINI
jgi:hypothetical protein